MADWKNTLISSDTSELSADVDELKVEAAPPGWYFIKDGQYTNANRRQIAANVRTALTNNGVSALTSTVFRPAGSLFWDTALNKFIADKVGDRYMVRINMSIVPSVNNRTLVFDFDIGTQNPPFTDTAILSQGAGVIHRQSFLATFGAGNGLLNNGGTFNVKSDVAVEIFDVSFDIIKQQRGR